MNRYVGLDVHKQFIEVCILDATGRVVWRGRTGCLRDELEAFARTKLKKSDRVALEATTNTWAVVAALRGTRPINRSGFDPGDPNQEGASGGDQQVQRRRPRRR